MLVYFPWLHQKNRVLTSRTLEYDKLDKLREWVISQNPSKDKSTHWWYSKLPADICLTFSKIAMSVLPIANPLPFKVPTNTVSFFSFLYLVFIL